MQGVSPHLFGPAPPQNSPSAQVPQSIAPLQPSSTWPQSAPTDEHVFFVQPPSPA